MARKAAFLNKSKFVSEHDDGSHDYEFTQSSDLVSIPSNLIPGLSGVSGGRVLLGDKAVLQAVSLKHREAPLVRPTDQFGKPSFIHRLGQELVSLRSQNEGVVTYVDADVIKAKDLSGKEHVYELYNNHQLGRKTALHYVPEVKVGDRISKGTLLATSNFSDKKGNLALGVNLTTAVMPYRSANFEDAIAVTESGAKKLVAEQILRFRVDTRFGVETNKAKYTSIFPNKYTNAQLAHLDADGVIKEGTELHYGDPYVLSMTPKSVRTTDINLGKIAKALKHAYTDGTHTWDYEHPGKVVRVSKSNDHVTIQVSTERTLQPGDKLCLTPDHDVLTLSGWKNITEIDVTDAVYTLNPDTHDIELRNPIATPAFEYSGAMYHCVTTQVDMCVTPNHKLYVGGRHADTPFKLVEAHRCFGKQYRLKNNGKWRGESPSSITIPGEQSLQNRPLRDVVIPTNQFMALLGLYLAEGNTFWHVASGTYGFDIPQKKKATTDKIKQLLDTLGFHYTRTRTGFRVHSKVMARYFKQFGLAYNKHIPRDVFNFSTQDLEVLYDWLMLGDGSQTQSGHGFTTTSKQLADDFQQLCLLIGKAAKITFRPGGKLVHFKNRKTPSVAADSYFCSIYKNKNEPSVNARSRKPKCFVEEWCDYTGKVYCLTFDKNHIFYVRRNGKCHWTGNSNNFGAKGVVQIIPDSHAPHDENGKPVDAILNSMSITSRVAPALLNTLALGKVAQKTGRHKHMLPFTKASSVDTAIDLLKKHGVNEQETLHDPVSGSKFKATVGPLYMNRLIHISEDKVSDRGAGGGYSLDEQPTKSEDDAAKRVGNLMTTALLSHGAEDVLRDIGLVKATKNDEWWRHVKMGLPPPPPKTPFIFEKFLSTLKGAGINVDRKGDVLSILPATDKDTVKLSSGPIHEPSTYKLKDNQLIPEIGGLFDPAKTGPTGNNFNHIDLDHSIPNPISEDYIRKLLGVTKEKYIDMVASGEIAKRLGALKIDELIKQQKDYLRSGKKTNRDNAFKLLGFLNNLKKNNLEVKDLLISKVPVIPAKFRPIAKMGDMTLTSDVNHLYKELILTKKALGRSAYLPEDKQHNLKKAHYQAVKAIYGLDESTSAKLTEKNVKGLLASMLGIQGNSAKMSTYQAKVVNKPVDLVGRSVLVPDASLDLDQASVPQSILWKTYAPFVIRNLVRRGVPVTKATEYVENKNPLAEQALMEELKHRPAIITRDPQLHKYSAQGFFLKPNPSEKDHTLKMNPLIFKGQGADADGDQLNIGVPASEEARKEVIEKMLPSRNILGPATFAPMYVPSNEASLGLFQLSTEDNKNTPKKYRTEADVVRAFEKGELSPGDRVIIG